jgi:aryl-alcohol dehydrogenase-like predicted oxidoreductase
MKYRTLGRTGVQVSELCLGTMAFGGDADAAEAARMFRAARDAGINFYDTADQYNAGRSEEVLGELIRGSRDELVIATKCYNPTGSDVNARGATRRHVRRAVEASLKRLGTDRIDLLFLHHYDARTPLEEHMRSLEDLVHSGKALYGAVSNYSAWQTQAALGYQERHGWAPLQAIQPMYSLVKRQVEVELLPMAQANSLAVVPYSPAGGGLLSGRYLQAGAQGRHTTNKMYGIRYGDQWMHETVAKFVALCKQRGWHPVSAAVAWVAAHPAITAPIIGGPKN